MVPALAWHIAEVMDTIEGWRRSYKYGKPGVTLYRKVSIPTPSWKLRLLDLLLMFVLCGAHGIYRRRLQNTRIAGKLYAPDFQAFIKSALRDWAGELLSRTLISAPD